MDRHATLADALDSRTPLARLTFRRDGAAPLEVPLPPITLGRLMQLLAFDPVQLVDLLASVLSSGREDADLPDGLDCHGLEEIVRVLMPDLPAGLWAECGTTAHVAELMTALAAGEDWSYLAGALGLDEEGLERRAEQEGEMDSETFLLGAATLLGRTPEQLLDMRAEGFYRLLEAAIERANKAV